jgi:hypothetical protein
MEIYTKQNYRIKKSAMVIGILNVYFKIIVYEVPWLCFIDVFLARSLAILVRLWNIGSFHEFKIKICWIIISHSQMNHVYRTPAWLHCCLWIICFFSFHSNRYVMFDRWLCYRLWLWYIWLDRHSIIQYKLWQNVLLKHKIRYI